MSAPAESPPPDDAAAAPKPAKSVPLALLLAVVVGLAAGGGAGAFGVGPLLAAGIAPMVQANAKAGKAHKAKPAHGEDGDAADGAADGEGHDAEGDDAAADDEGDGGGEAAAEEGGHGKEGPASNVYTLDNLVLNPAESGGTRFLLLSISFQVRDAATLEAMKARDAEMRDAVLVTVGNRTVDQLATVAVRDSLKLELKAAARKLFRKSVVRRVYFPQFVIQ